MKRDRRQHVERARPRYTEAAVRREANVPPTGPIPKHGGLLYHALACWAGLPFDHQTTGLFPSRNMWALLMGPLAHRDPVLAARVIVAELTAELRSTLRRGRRRYLGDDELLSVNPYTAWYVLGLLLASRALSERPEAICREACRLIVEALGRQAALFALVATMGVARGPSGREDYRWLLTRCAGLRAPPVMLRTGSAAAVWGLLGGPLGAWAGDEPPILAAAIAELAGLWRTLAGWYDDGTDVRLWGLALTPVGSPAWREGVERAQRVLADSRTAVHYQIRHYRSGARATLILGPTGGGSTAPLPGVLVTGLECAITEQEAQRQLDRGGPIRCADVVAGFPEPKERERNNDAGGEGWIERRGGREVYVCTDGPGREGKRVEMELLDDNDLALVADLSEGAAPVFDVRAAA
jgi:hypothetical protein